MHLPYAPWCLCCIGGRAKDAVRRRPPERPDEPDVVQIDYTFIIGVAPGDKLMPIFIAMVQRTAYGFAHLVPAKGMVTEN
eukprot:5862884-Heterocapsa_arctica.AAC.1